MVNDSLPVGNLTDDERVKLLALVSALTSPCHTVLIVFLLPLAQNDFNRRAIEQRCYHSWSRSDRFGLFNDWPHRTTGKIGITFIYSLGIVVIPRSPEKCWSTQWFTLPEIQLLSSIYKPLFKRWYNKLSRFLLKKVRIGGFFTRWIEFVRAEKRRLL